MSKSLVSFAAVSFLAVASAASAAVVNIDINTATSKTYSGQGALATTGNLWNGVLGGAVASNLYASDGTQMTASFIVTGNSNLTPGSSASSIATSPAVVDTGADLLNDGATVSGFAGPTVQYFQISGLVPLSSYTLVLYSTWGRESSDPNQGVNQRLGGNFNNYNNVGANLPAWYNLSTTSLGVSGTVFTAGVDYVTFTAIPTADGVIKGRFQPNNGTSAMFNGLQVSGNFNQVPEPTTLAVIGLAGTLLMRRRRAR